MWRRHGHGRRPGYCGWRHGRLRLGSLPGVCDNNVTTSACHWRKLCCGHYDDLLDLLALLHRPRFIRRETLGVFLQQRHRQTKLRHFGVLLLHRTWSCVPFDKISKGGSDDADPLPLLLHFAVSTKQRSEATGTFIWHFLSVIGFGRLISLRILSHLYFGRQNTASLVFLDRFDPHLHGWFQGGHLLDASTS